MLVKAVKYWYTMCKDEGRHTAKQTPLYRHQIMTKNKYIVSCLEGGNEALSSEETFATLAEAATYVQDRWQGEEYMDGDSAFHTDYSRYYLEGFTLKDIGTLNCTGAWPEFVFHGQGYGVGTAPKDDTPSTDIIMTTMTMTQPTLTALVKEARAAYKRHTEGDRIVAEASKLTPVDLSYPAALKVWQTLVSEGADPFAANAIALALEPYHKCVAYLAADAAKFPYRHRVAAWTVYEFSSYDEETNTYHRQGECTCPQGEQSSGPDDPLTYVEVTYPVEGASWWADYINTSIIR